MPILQTRRQSQREVKQLVQSHTWQRWQSWDLNSSDPKVQVLNQCPLFHPLFLFLSEILEVSLGCDSPTTGTSSVGALRLLHAPCFPVAAAHPPVLTCRASLCPHHLLAEFPPVASTVCSLEPERHLLPGVQPLTPQEQVCSFQSRHHCQQFFSGPTTCLLLTL